MKQDNVPHIHIVYTPHRTAKAQCTAPQKQHFLACGSRLSPSLKVMQIMCSSKELFLFLAHHVSFTRRCLNTIFHTTLRLSQFFHTFHLHRIHAEQDGPVEVRDCFDFRAYKAVQEEGAAYLNSLKRNIIRDYFLRSKAIKYCLKHDRK